MGDNISVILINLLVLICFIQVVQSCNIRELNNVIEDHFKKELQLKKCAEAGQKVSFECFH